MGPRKNSRRVAAVSSPNTVPLSSPPLAPSASHSTISLPIFAGTKLWNTLDIRLNILQHITDLSDLARLIRVERRAMALIAEKLYSVIKHRHLRSKMSVSTPRRRMYENAVSNLDCRELTLTLTLIRKYHLDTEPTNLYPIATTAERSAIRNSDLESDSEAGSDSGWTEPPAFRRAAAAATKARVKTWLESYHPELLKDLLPGLRKQFPELKKLIFGPEYEPFGGRTSWVVELDPRAFVPLDWAPGQEAALGEVKAEGFGSANLGGIGTGSIKHIRTLGALSWSSPPTVAEYDSSCPTSFSTAYTMCSRFDLKCTSNLPTLFTYGQDWLHSLAHSPIYSHLYRAADFGFLPVTLPIITSLFQRQLDAGHTDRLQIIHAIRIFPFDLDTFQAFATIASSSLTQLIVCTSQALHTAAIPSDQSIDFLGIVQHSLPNLAELEFRIQSFDGVEEILRDQLSEDLLCRRGGLSKLWIYAAEPVPAIVFNVIRFASIMLGEGANFELVGWERGTGIRLNSSEHIHHLRSEDFIRRQHLSTVDFAFLGINDLREIFALTYDTLDKPQHLLAVEIAKWLATYKTTVPEALSEVNIPISAIENATAQLNDATSQLVLLSKPHYIQSSVTAGSSTAEAQILDQLQLQQGLVRTIASLAQPSMGISASSLRTLRGIVKSTRVLQIAAG